MERSFKLENNGTLDISKVLLKTDYEVNDAKGDNKGAGSDFGEHILVEFLYNTTGDQDYEVLKNYTLAQLKTMTEDDLAVQIEEEWVKHVQGNGQGQGNGNGNGNGQGQKKENNNGKGQGSGEYKFSLVDGIEVGQAGTLKVKFVFVDNGEDQNMFQGDSLNLKWSFTGEQTAGEQK